MRYDNSFGHVIYKIKDDMLFISYFKIKDEYRGEGKARILLDMMIEADANSFKDVKRVAAICCNTPSYRALSAFCQRYSFQNCLTDHSELNDII